MPLLLLLLSLMLVLVLGLWKPVTPAAWSSVRAQHSPGSQNSFWGSFPNIYYKDAALLLWPQRVWQRQQQHLEADTYTQ